jgi:hypothetical protein
MWTTLMLTPRPFGRTTQPSETRRPAAASLFSLVARVESTALIGYMCIHSRLGGSSIVVAVGRSQHAVNVYADRRGLTCLGGLALPSNEIGWSAPLNYM